MKEIRKLALALAALMFVAGAGMGVWAGRSIAATPDDAAGVDRRLEDFRTMLDLTPSQTRRVRDVLVWRDREVDRIRNELTPEQYRRIGDVNERGRARIDEILTPEQRSRYQRARRE